MLVTVLEQPSQTPFSVNKGNYYKCSLIIINACFDYETNNLKILLIIYQITLKIVQQLLVLKCYAFQH